MAQQSPVRLMLRLHSGVKDIDRTVNLVRDVLMSGVPEVGDEIAVDAGETRLIPVAKRHWSFDGKAIVRLRDVVVDPYADTRLTAQEVCWHSGPEGDPDDLLRADGWRDE